MSSVASPSRLSPQADVPAASARREALLNLALSVGRCGTFERDMLTGLGRWSPETEAIYGLEPGGFDGLRETWLGFIHPQDRNRVQEAMQAALERRETALDVAYRIVRPDGRIRHLESRTAFAYDAAGAPTAVYGVNVDITERALAEERAQEGERRYHTLFDAVPIGLVVSDPETLALVAFNDHAFAQLGYDREEFARLTIADIDAQETPEQSRAKTAQLAAFDGKLQFETKHRAKDGALRDVVVTARRIDWDGRTLIYASWVDVTAETRVRAELAQTGRLLRAIADATEDLIYAKDREGRLLFANPATLRAIGRTWEEVAGRTVAEYHPDADRAAMSMAADRRIVETGEPAVVEERFATPDGERVFLSSKTPMRDAQDAIVGVVGIATDITDRKRREEHLEFVMRELTHRTKNLLAVIQSIARQTGQVSLSADDFQARFMPRLQGLAESHDLLVKSDWQGATLDDLIRSQLGRLFEGWSRQVELRGEALTLTPEAAQNLGLAFHELSSNAVKHGALSRAGGRIIVEWAREGDEVRIAWLERDGPPIDASTHGGFGQVVLERVVPRALGGQATLARAPQGLTWTIAFPATNLLSPAPSA